MGPEANSFPPSQAEAADAPGVDGGNAEVKAEEAGEAEEAGMGPARPRQGEEDGLEEGPAGAGAQGVAAKQEGTAKEAAEGEEKAAKEQGGRGKKRRRLGRRRRRRW